jgi:hypothetical protein
MSKEEWLTGCERRAAAGCDKIDAAVRLLDQAVLTMACDLGVIDKDAENFVDYKRNALSGTVKQITMRLRQPGPLAVEEKWAVANLFLNLIGGALAIVKKRAALEKFAVLCETETSMEKARHARKKKAMKKTKALAESVFETAKSYAMPLKDSDKFALRIKPLLPREFQEATVPAIRDTVRLLRRNDNDQH